MNNRMTIGRRGFIAGTGAAGIALAAPWVVRSARAADSFRVGALNPISGAGNVYGSGMQQAILFTAADVNKAGGAAGREIEVFAEDSQTNPDAAVLAAKKLVEVNKCEAILGTWSSSITLAVMGAVTQPGNIIQTCTSGSGSITTADTKDLTWRFAPLSITYGRVYAQLAKEMGFERPAVLALNNPAGLAQKEGFQENWKKLGGGDVPAVVYEAKRASYRSEMQQILSHNPDVIITGSYSNDMTIIIREWYQTGIPAKFIAPSWAANAKLIEAVGNDAVEDVNTVFGTSNLESPAFDRFNKMYKDATGEDGEGNKYAAMCHDMVNVLALAMEAAGPGADRAAINGKFREVSNSPGLEVGSFEEGAAELRKGTKINYQGAGTVAQFDENGDDNPDVFEWSKILGGKSVSQKLIRHSNT